MKRFQKRLVREMSRYNDTFARLSGRREGALIPFVVLGDPDFETSQKILGVLCEKADILELGFPFSDPIADGKRIQAADQRALSAGISVEKCFELIKGVRAKNPSIPIGLLLYYNLVYTNGCGNFLKRAKDAGVDGILIADMPVEESGAIAKLCRKIGIEQIFIVAQTTDGKRMKKILRVAAGFVYVVGVLGVTGERRDVGDAALETIRRAKAASRIPVCMGFGISEPSHVEKVIRAGADGAIIGSALEAVIERNLGDREKMIAEISAFIEKLKGATKAYETDKASSGN